MPPSKTIELEKIVRSSTRMPQSEINQTRPVSLVAAVAKLLSNYELRQQFEQAPELVANQLGVGEEEFGAFISLSPLQLERQANTLLNKRWHEIRRLVPLTIESLGKEAHDLFRFYATKDWPIGHRRHPADALRFMQFLVANKIKEPNKMEWKRMRRINRSPAS